MVTWKEYWQARYDPADKKIKGCSPGSYAYDHELGHLKQDERGLLVQAFVLVVWIAVLGIIAHFVTGRTPPLSLWLIIAVYAYIEFDAHRYAWRVRRERKPVDEPEYTNNGLEVVK